MADTDPAPDPQPQPKPELAERVGAIEAEQQRQGGVLEEIKGMLAGRGNAPTGGAGSTADPDAGSVAEQVRKGVEEIEARKQREAEAAAAKDAAEARLKGIEDRLPERRPAEPATGRKTRLQERLFGKADAR